MRNYRKPLSLLAGAVVFATVILVNAWATTAPLPQRSGPVPQTTNAVPHIQIDARPVPELTNRFLDQVAAIPGVRLRPTVISLPGAKGFWLNEDLKLAKPQSIVGGREFAHLHPDGSLHASLPPDRAQEAVNAGWAVMHPWSTSRPGWEGFVLLFTPRTKDEAEVTFQLIVDGYNYVTGRNYRASAH